MTSDSPAKYPTREGWLQAAIDDLRPVFQGQNLVLPKLIHVSIGWPSSRGLSSQRRVLGECWDRSRSSDGSHHIFVSPLIDELVKGQGVLGVLTHELVHAAVGCEAKHGPKFAKACRLLGFEGKPTHNYPGPILEARLYELAERLGQFPHAVLRPVERAAKKQTTRMRKCECETCGYLCRTTGQWLTKHGPPICPCNKQPMYAEPPKDEGEIGPEEGFQGGE